MVLPVLIHAELEACGLKELLKELQQSFINRQVFMRCTKDMRVIPCCHA